MRILRCIPDTIRTRTTEIFYFMDDSARGHWHAFWLYHCYQQNSGDRERYLLLYGWLRVRALRCVEFLFFSLALVVIVALILLCRLLNDIWFDSLSYETRSGYCDCVLIYKDHSMYTVKLSMLLQICVRLWMFAAPRLIPRVCTLFFTWHVAVKIFTDWLMYTTHIYIYITWPQRKIQREFFFMTRQTHYYRCAWLYM